MDGTIVDVDYDWNQIRSELMTQGKPILTYLSHLEEPEKSEKWRILEKHEDEATHKARLKPGIRELLDWLTEKGVKKALVTNNSQKNVSFLLKKFDMEFEYVITRESGLWKPSAAPILAVLKKLGLKREECCVVGDSHFDVKAANKAGIAYVFILSENEERFFLSGAELFKSIRKLRERIEKLL